MKRAEGGITTIVNQADFAPGDSLVVIRLTEEGAKAEAYTSDVDQFCSQLLELMHATVQDPSLLGEVEMNVLPCPHCGLPHG